MDENYQDDENEYDFRLNEDKAIINRYGFNSEGHDVVFERLRTLQLKYLD